MTKLTIKDILAEHINELAPIPPQTKMVKIEKSDSTDEKKPSTIELDQPYCGVTRWQFQHILKIPGQNTKRYAGGGIGVVKKGFGQNLVCAIKIFKDKKYEDRVKNAENEVKYNCLLGREAIWGIMNGKSYVYAPWIEGMNMHDYAQHLARHAQDSKYALPFKKPRRYTLLQMFRNYLKQAKIFHDLGLILGDPKSRNAMVDTVNGTIEIVDFDAIHPIGTRGTAYTHKYLSPNLITRTSGISQLYSQADDIYIFGLMLAELFPLVFNIIYTDQKPTQIRVGFSHYKELVSLVLRMTHGDPRRRPLINDCLGDVDALLKIHTPKGVPEVKGKDKMDLLSEKLKEREKNVLLGELRQSIIDDKPEKAQVILSADPETLNQICVESKHQTTTPFTLALEYKRIGIVEFAFKHALETADLKLVDFILKSDLSKKLLNKKLMQDRLPLVMACELKENGDGDKEKIIDALLENGAELEDGADLSLCNERFLTKLLYHALQNSDMEKIKKIGGANKRILNNQLPNGLLPLAMAIAIDNEKISDGAKLEVIMFLLKNGAGIRYNVNVQITVNSDSFKNVLHKEFWSALKSGDKDTAILLLAHFSELTEIWHVGDHHKSSVLMMAAYYNQKEIVQYLINKKIDVFAVNLKGETAEDILRNEKPKHREIIKILNDAAFRQALNNQDYKRFSQSFEQQKAKGVNVRFEDGSTPLTKLLDCKLINAGGKQIMSELLKHDVDLSNSDGNGKFPLKMVMEHKELDSLVKAHLFSRKKEQCYSILKLIAQNLIVDINDRILKYQLRLDERSELFKSQKTKDKLGAANTLRDNLKSLETTIYSQDSGKVKSHLDSNKFCNARYNFITAAKIFTVFGKNFSEEDEKFIKKVAESINSMERELKMLHDDTHPSGLNYS